MADISLKAGTKMKRTPVGEIPVDWECVDLSSAAALKRGRFSPRPRNDPRYYGGNIPFVQTGDVTNSNGRVTTYTQTLNDDGLKVSILFPEGTVLITIAANIGYSAILKFPMACPDSLIGIICKKSLNNEYLNYFLRNNRSRIEYIAPSGAQKNINVEFLSGLPVPLPPLPEQKKIAEILSTWDAAIEKTQKLIEEKEKQKKGLMQRLLIDCTLYGENKNGWQEVRLGSLFKERKETGYNDLPLLSVTGTRGVIPHAAMGKKDSSNEDKSKYKRIVAGDIGYNTMRMWQGNSALSNLEGLVSPAYTICIPREKVNAVFMSILFKFKPMIHLFYRHSQGLVSDTWNLKYHHFSRIKINLPCLREQKMIADIFSTLEAEINAIKTRVELLRKQKKGLMQKLLTGKVRVKV